MSLDGIVALNSLALQLALCSRMHSALVTGRWQGVFVRYKAKMSSRFSVRSRTTDIAFPALSVNARDMRCTNEGVSTSLWFCVIPIVFHHETEGSGWSGRIRVVEYVAPPSLRHVLRSPPQPLRLGKVLQRGESMLGTLLI